jgi:predicted ATPase/DNA-binding winged helix-turn-helix (wHTH) protein
MLHDAKWEGDDLISFGSFRLFPANRLLEKAGVPVRLGDRALDILLILTAQAPGIVSKATLLAQVWPDVTVEEGSLRVQMTALRKALGDGEFGVRYVATVQGRGYRFVVPIARSKISTLHQAFVVGGGDISPAEDELPSPAAPETTKPETNLPQRLAAVIGRATELAELRENLGRSRLVTLVGSGGIGKTRLAIEFGWQAAGLFPGGVWLIDLAPVTDPAVVTSATATVLGVALRDAGTPVEAIAAAIGKQRKLLIFDNCEHLLAAAADLIEALLERAPGLSVLASQENLHVQAEQIYRLNPLALPPSGAAHPKSSVGKIAGFGAVALFVERARAADRRFALDAGNAAGVAEICRRRDGIPLALEMAAARLPLLGIEGLRARLDERLRMLTTGPHTAETRHRTLRDMVEWSLGLLDRADQHLFRRLAIFAGSFSLDAALAVAGGETDHWTIIDALGRLIDKSLVVAETGEQPRYRLLETLRLYAMEELRRNDEFETVAALHARYFTELFGRSDALWETAPEAEWLAVYRPEIDNVRGALDWALADPNHAQVAIALAGTAALLWQTLALFAEGRRYVDRVATLIDRETPPAAAARLLRSAGSLWYNSDRLRALAQQERSVALYRQIGDHLNLATVLSSLGSLYASLGRNEEAKTTLREAEKILSASDRKRSLFNVMNNLGTLAGFMNEIAEARHSFARALDLARAGRDVGRENYILMNLAEIEFVLGSIDRAVERAREAVSGLRSTDRRSFLELGLINLGSYLIFQGSLAEARSVAEEALSAAREEGGFVVRVCLQQWALLGALDGRHREAAQLIGFVDAGYAISGDIRQPSAQRIHDRLAELLEAKLPAADIRAFAAAGARWSEAEAVAFAVDRFIAPAE